MRAGARAHLSCHGGQSSAVWGTVRHTCANITRVCVCFGEYEFDCMCEDACAACAAFSIVVFVMTTGAAGAWLLLPN